MKEPVVTIPIPKIFTSTFDKLEDINAEGYYTYLALVEAPKGIGLNIKVIPQILPNIEDLSEFEDGSLSRLEFSLSYRDLLDKLSIDKLIEIITCLVRVESSDGMILLGRVDNPIYCPRGILADILNKSGKLKYKVVEWKE